MIMEADDGGSGPLLETSLAILDLEGYPNPDRNFVLVAFKRISL